MRNQDSDASAFSFGYEGTKTWVWERSHEEQPIHQPIEELALIGYEIRPGCLQQRYRVGREDQRLQEEILRHLRFRIRRIEVS